MSQQQTTFPAAINLSTAGTDDILQWLVAAVTHVNQQAVTDTQHFNTELAAAGAAVNALQTSVNQLIAAQGSTSGTGSSGGGTGGTGGTSGSSGGTGGSSGTGGTSGPPATTSTVKIKMAAPNKFDGTKREEAVAFRIACSRYIATNMPAHTDEQKIAFITSYLEGTASEWVNAFEEQRYINNIAVPWLSDLAQFWTEFGRQYGDVNRSENHRALLRKLKQNKTVQEYVTQFNLYASGLGYNDAALRDQFYDGLSDEIRNSMIAQNYDPTAHSATEVADRALEIDRHLISFGGKKSANTSTNKSSNSSTKTSATTSNNQSTQERFSRNDRVYMIGTDGRAKKGQITKIGPGLGGRIQPTVKWDGDSSEVKLQFRDLKKDTKPTLTPPPKKDPDAMDIDNAGKGKKPVICNKCGGKGHWANQCPSKEISGYEAFVEDPDTSDEESGKEGA
ncbi:Retrotransposon gag protein [Ceratobasidium sp. AG-Ba]|nr:Retrotransposon gag protein [Ceratobasidium sp. AG-Ba]